MYHHAHVHHAHHAHVNVSSCSICLQQLSYYETQFYAFCNIKRRAAWEMLGQLCYLVKNANAIHLYFDAVTITNTKAIYAEAKRILTYNPLIVPRVRRIIPAVSNICPLLNADIKSANEKICLLSTHFTAQQDFYRSSTKASFYRYPPDPPLHDFTGFTPICRQVLYYICNQWPFTKLPPS